MIVAQEIIGYIVWDRKLHTIYRGRVYDMLPDAQKVRDGVVWYSRDRYEVRGIVLSEVTA
jgi:hypothetical protein